MKELTRGNPFKIILAFALPIIAGNLFQQMYNMVDSIIVGRAIGVEAFASLGSTSYVSNLLIGFMSGLTNGFSIVTARHFGAGDREKVRRSVAGTIILGLSVSAIFTVLSMFLLKHFLRLLDTPDEIFDMAYGYIRIILMFMTTAMLYNMAAGVLRAVGDSLTPLIFLIISSFVNIGLDLLFIVKFNMGINGAAYATIISQAFSFILCCIYIIVRFPYLIPKKEEFRITLHEVGQLMSMGLSFALMFSIVEIGSLVLQRAINGFGTDTIAAHTAARKISSILMLPYSALGSACATYCSQNLGANKPHRVFPGIRSAILISWIWSAVAILIGYTASGFIVELIAGTENPYIVDTASTYLRINTPFYFVLGVLIVMRSSLQGLGRKTVPVASSVIEMIGKAVVAFVLAPMLGYFGVMISEPSVWILMTILLVLGYVTDKELMAKTFPKRKKIENT